MTFADANQAKEFFISRIAAQAESERAPLAELERKMLKWTEFHPIPDISPEELAKLDEEFSEQYDQDEWEKKIVGLIRRGYESDRKSGAASRETYKAAYDAMRKEDHYIQVMIDQAIGSKLKGSLGLV